MIKERLILIIMLLVSNIIYSQKNGKVIAIKDGDTVVILDDTNTEIILRLAEVDCPENSQPFGKNAKKFTSEQIFGSEIEYFATSKDRYGRTIAKIYYNGKYLSEEIIKNGWGWWYYQYSNNRNLGYLESQARAKLIGLWQDKNPIAPWEWRRK